MAVDRKVTDESDWTVCIIPDCGKLSQSPYGRWCSEHLANYRRHGDPLESWGPGRRDGRKRSPEYQSWLSMWTRCTNSDRAGWKDYGGRGIVICDDWKSYDQFAIDMGSRPAGTTLDRIDNDGNYEPTNCRWATRGQQRVNQRYRETVNTGKVCFVGDCDDLAECRGKCNRHYRQELHQGRQPREPQ
jgi:hypothetical protein